MKPVFEVEHLALFEAIRDESGPNQAPFVVGGAVRDALLEKPLHDLDFVMAEKPIRLAKRLAKRLNAGFFVLDDDRNTARVIYYNQNNQFFPLDFVQFTGESLQEDLSNRDFTINAMAISVDELTHVIDPLDGQTDLQQGYLRACSEHALTDDPVRVLRGVRLAIQFGFKYAQGLESAMRTAAKHLPKTSYERQRDEFFRLLAGPDPAEGLRDCMRFGIFETLIPAVVDLESIPASPPHQLPLFEHTLKTVDGYHHVLCRLTTDSDPPDEGDWILEEVLDGLGIFSKAIENYFKEEITPGRSKAALAYFGALLHDVGKPLTVKAGDDERLHFDHHAPVGADLAYEAAKRLQLSNAESEWVRRMVRYHMRILPYIETGSAPDRRTVYRFFKVTGDAGVAIVLHTLADTLATFCPNLERERWQRTINVAKTLLSACWEHYEAVVSPVPLLDGHDLQRIFGLKPGKKIGRLLSHLIEEQASGNIRTKEEAQEFVQASLDQMDG